MLPTVDFCGLKVTRLIIGANPFGGFSHQNKERDQEMVKYYTPERIQETWGRAKAAGINTMITNNHSPNVMQALKDYLAKGGPLQWIGQISCWKEVHGSMFDAVDEAVALGAKAFYFHGGVVDDLYVKQDEKTLRTWVEHARKYNIPVGVAGHIPDAHHWVDNMNLVDFHVVCFFPCGSLHSGKGHKFRLADILSAVQCIRRIRKPCIGYKIMGAGRIDPVMAFEFAFENIKSGDVVNVGMHRGDKDNIVEENVELVRRILKG
ncbi:MAG: hypothetical protein AB1696_00735 [Planctomycetota bacterium]